MVPELKVPSVLTDMRRHRQTPYFLNLIFSTLLNSYIYYNGLFLIGCWLGQIDLNNSKIRVFGTKDLEDLCSCRIV